MAPPLTLVQEILLEQAVGGGPVLGRLDHACVGGDYLFIACLGDNSVAVVRCGRVRALAEQNRVLTRTGG